MDVAELGRPVSQVVADALSRRIKEGQVVEDEEPPAAGCRFKRLKRFQKQFEKLFEVPICICGMFQLPIFMEFYMKWLFKWSFKRCFDLLNRLPALGDIPDGVALQGRREVDLVLCTG